MTEPPRTPKRSQLFRAGRACAASLVIIGILIGIGACMNVGERLAYFPSRDAFVTPPGVEDVDFVGADGVRLHGWFMPALNAAPGERRPAVLHVHGNAGHVGAHAGFSAFLREHGIHVLAFDYRGYGRSDDARPTRDALLADTRAALAALRDRPDVDAHRIGIYGASLGGTFALPAAAEDPSVRAVVTLSAFSTWRGVAHDMLPVLGPMLIRRGLDPEDAAARLGSRPYLIVHGDADGVINARHAQRLLEKAIGAEVDAELVVVPGADHNTIIDRHAEAREAIAGFFATHLAQEPQP